MLADVRSTYGKTKIWYFAIDFLISFDFVLIEQKKFLLSIRWYAPWKGGEVIRSLIGCLRVVVFHLLTTHASQLTVFSFILSRIAQLACEDEWEKFQFPNWDIISCIRDLPRLPARFASQFSSVLFGLGAFVWRDLPPRERRAETWLCEGSHT